MDSATADTGTFAAPAGASVGARVAAAVERQRANLALWVPVFFAVGIGVYFTVPREPEGWMLAALAALFAMGFATALRTGPVARVLLMAALLPVAGFEAAAVRARAVAAPVLAYPMTANVEGRVVGLDRSAGDRDRVLLEAVVIHGLEPARTPGRVRISVDPSTPASVLRPGARLIGYARLSPPPAPAEPGGFDFRRMAWFDGLGAVGYTRTPMLEAWSDDGDGSGGGGWRHAVFAARTALSRAIQAAVPGRNGGFASAILTGDRAGVDPAALAALRASNLAHLLAISGLHMGLLTGFVFALIRYGLALVPRIALHHPTKKLAAAVALVAGAAYLVLSGANVATERAFVMTAVVLVAVMIDRPAFTLRSVALAAMVVLASRPESLTEAGFQMSFAATTALIAAFEALRTRAWWRELQGERWRYLRPVIGVTVTSFVAGLATSPISAFHFNTLSQYGLLANVLAVPAMGLVVMPAAVLAGLLAPLGLAAPAFWAMGLGLDYILRVAEFVAGIEGAVRPVPAGPMASLVLIVAGGLFAILWIGRARFLGVLPILGGILLWAQADRPDILISEDGRLFGIVTAEGRALNTPKGNGFAASSWLENDGDRAGQVAAFERASMGRGRGRAEYDVPGVGPLRYIGSRAPDAKTRDACREAAVVLAPGWRDVPPGPCLFVGADRLRRAGAIAIDIGEDGALALEGAKARDRGRPWTADPGRRTRGGAPASRPD